MKKSRLRTFILGLITDVVYAFIAFSLTGLRIIKNHNTFSKK